MKTTRNQILMAVVLVGVPVTTVACAQPAAQEKAAPAAGEQSAYATAVEAYIRFQPRYYTYGFEKLMTRVPEPLTRPAAPLNQVGIYIQKDSPGKDKESNWLPSPAGEFNLMCRVYGPQQALMDGTHKLPPVNRAE
jgi:hypothetical protein